MRALISKTNHFLINNLQSVWISFITVLYGFALIYSNSQVRLIEPPFRYLLKFMCFFLPLLLIYSLIKDNRKLSGWVIISLSLLWWFIAWLYFINPVNNSGWILAISNIGHAFILLFRGRFKNESK